MNKMPSYSKFLLLFIFAVTMANVEAMIVVYLREAFYPEGFSFPLKLLPHRIIIIEIIREAATLVMLTVVAGMAGSTRWERLGYFIGLFGLWDIFYYLWLKVTIDWPETLFDWDILFLIPLPWIGPVIAPVLVALFMLAGCILILWMIKRNYRIKASASAVITAIAGTIVILYSFMYDLSATIHLQMPRPYPYYLLVIGLILYAVSLLELYRLSRKYTRYYISS